MAGIDRGPWIQAVTQAVLAKTPGGSERGEEGQVIRRGLGWLRRKLGWVPWWNK